MNEVEYYTTRPIDNSLLKDGLIASLDAAISNWLQTGSEPLPIKLLYQFAGPASAADGIFEISNQGGNIFVNGIQVAAAGAVTGAITRAISDFLVTAVVDLVAAEAGAALIALGVEIGAAVAAVIVYDSFVKPVVHNITDWIFGTQDIHIDLVVNGKVVGGAFYPDNIGSQTRMAAILDLLSVAKNNSDIPDPAAGMEIRYQVQNTTEQSFLIVKGDILASIAAGLSVSEAEIAGWNWAQDGSGNTVANSALLFEVPSTGTPLSAVDQLAKLALDIHTFTGTDRLLVDFKHIGLDNKTPMASAITVT